MKLVDPDNDVPRDEPSVVAPDLPLENAQALAKTDGFRC